LRADAGAGTPFVGQHDLLVTAGAERLQRAVDQLGRIRGINGAAVTRPVADAGARDVERQVLHGARPRRPALDASLGASRALDSRALAARGLELVVDLIPGPVPEDPAKAADRDRAPHLERELEVSVHLHAMPAEEAALACVQLEG